VIGVLFNWIEALLRCPGNAGAPLAGEGIGGQGPPKNADAEHGTRHNPHLEQDRF